MRLQKLFNLEKLFQVGISIFFSTILVVRSVVTEDSRYEACVPRNCGNGPNISYPFYIIDAGVHFCGRPGFQIKCDENKLPVYWTSEGHYVIKDISYETQTFQLVDEEVANSTTTCFAPPHKFAFDRSSVDFSSTHANLQFFYGCNESFTLGFDYSLIHCKSNASHLSYVTLVHKDEDLSDGEGCESEVGVPVDLEGDYFQQTIKTVNYPELLKKGFTLKWHGNGCVKCKTSGGRCGFENESVCFCPDGTHLTDCNDGKTLRTITCLV